MNATSKRDAGKRGEGQGVAGVSGAVSTRAYCGPSSGDAGFTLVETLVSLALMALLAMMLATGMHTGRRAWESLESQAARGQSVAQVQSLLRTRLERAFPAIRYDASRPYVEFAGATDRVQFLAPPPDASAPAALDRYTLAMTTGGNLVLASASTLLARVDRAAGAGERTRIWTDRLLLSRIDGFELAYFGSAAPDYQRRWRSRWQSEPALPELVRLRVRFAGTDRRNWPDLIVHPAATLDSGCIVDSARAVCRGRS